MFIADYKMIHLIHICSDNGEVHACMQEYLDKVQAWRNKYHLVDNSNDLFQ